MPPERNGVPLVLPPWAIPLYETFSDYRKAFVIIIVAVFLFPFVATGVMFAVHIGKIPSVSTQNMELLNMNNKLMTEMQKGFAAHQQDSQRQGEQQVRISLAQCVNNPAIESGDKASSRKAIEICLSSLEDSPRKMIQLIREKIQ